MLRLRRRPARTHAQLVRDELSESLDHFVQAANHAAGGVGATVGPRIDAARDRVAPATDTDASPRPLPATARTIAVLTPLAVAAKDGALEGQTAASRSRRRNAGRR